MKVTLVPEHIAPDGTAAMLTLAGKFAFTVMVIVLEVAGLPVKQGVLIDEVTPDSPASEAGLQGGNRPVSVRDLAVCAGGDIIISINELQK